jgi:PAS domain S-box-containing protein
VKLLTNPIFIRMIVVGLASGFAFVMGLALMRRMRRSITRDAFASSDNSSSESFPLQTFHAVIQQLKQQKQELQSLQQKERRRAKTSENISAAVLSSLSCGVIFFTPNGIVRQANAGARQILGFASLAGMGTREIFREASLGWDESGSRLAETMSSYLRENASCGRLAARYFTPGGQLRLLDITVSPMHGPKGEVLGSACVINNHTEIAQIRQEQELRGEMSVEMAFELRNSLATISEYARQLANCNDPGLARQLAGDIGEEAAQLERTIGGFLVGRKAVASG